MSPRERYVSPEENAISDCSAAQSAAGRSECGVSEDLYNSLLPLHFDDRHNPLLGDLMASSDKPNLKASGNESHANEAKDVSIVNPGTINRSANLGASGSMPQDAELAVIVKAWPDLEEEVRKTILFLIKKPNTE